MMLDLLEVLSCRPISVGAALPAGAGAARKPLEEQLTRTVGAGVKSMVAEGLSGRFVALQEMAVGATGDAFGSTSTLAGAIRA
jgi:hypothetical protein